VTIFPMAAVGMSTVVMCGPIIDTMGYAEEDKPGLRRDLDNFMPIFVRSLGIGNILDFDLYVFNGCEMVLFRAARLPLTSEACKSLLESNLNRLYIAKDDRSLYQKHVQTHIGQILADPTIDGFTKATIVYDSAKDLVKDLFTDPTRGEKIRDSQAFVESTVLYVLEGQNAFHNMLRVMSFDYTVYTHSVNVCTFSLALAHAAGITKTNDLIELGTGALLHDIGKVKIPEAILHKNGPLDQSEWKTIRLHPQWGVEIVSETDTIPENSYLPIQQHHERQDGTGYPNGLAGADIHIYGKIVAISDAFDAMTTNRIYRPAQSSFPALQTMAEQDEGFDKSLLQRFIKLLGPTRSE
jgi:putative nucleotidyltransferase with HDIG domain